MGMDIGNYVEDEHTCADNVSASSKLIDVGSYPVRDLLSILVEDKTTKKNIIWATDAYSSYGESCSHKDHINPEIFFSKSGVRIVPRIHKCIEEQQERTRAKAEVFTPIWICNTMNNHCDEQWFGRPDIFNHENDDHSWTVTEGNIIFPEGRTWQEYVDSRRLEITCGEAPYLVSRYDASTGDFILPLIRRIGILDRKLRIVNENTDTLEDWTKWTIRAYQSCYGYEWQGDSLLIARINLLLTFCDHFNERWSSQPDMDILRKIANIISWNIWQMDGLKDTVPFGKPYTPTRQMTLFDSFSGSDTSISETEKEDVAHPCKIYDWRRDNSRIFKDCKKRGKMSKLFDFVIGNPPWYCTYNHLIFSL